VALWELAEGLFELFPQWGLVGHLVVRERLFSEGASGRRLRLSQKPQETPADSNCTQLGGEGLPRVRTMVHSFGCLTLLAF
jgi:hypothetical protein